MIVYKKWKRIKYKSYFAYSANTYWLYEGWFLLGFIPLYIRRYGVDKTY